MHLHVEPALSRRTRSVLAAIALTVAGSDAANAAAAPSFKDVLSVPSVDTPRISRDGTAIAYVLKTADWARDRYVKSIYVARAGQPAREFVDGSSASVSEPRWSPDGATLAFLKDGEAGPQLWTMPSSGGAARSLTNIPGGVLGYEWSPDGKRIALIAVEGPDPRIAARAGDYGDFAITGEDPPRASLWLLAKDKGTLKRVAGGPHLSVTAFSVAGLRNNFSFSPDGRQIAFTSAASLAIADAVQSTVAVVDLDTGAIRHLTQGHSHWDETPVFSPDGKNILFARTALDDFPTDNALLIVAAKGGSAVELKAKTPTADHQPLILDWTKSGIHAFYLDRTRQVVFRIDPASGAASALTAAPATITQADVSSDGRVIAALGADGRSAPDVYRIAGKSSVRLSANSAITAKWPAHKAELVQWTSPDGVKVEGILYSRADLRAGASAPLIELLHGGPRELATPTRLHNAIYPIEQWVAQGARVLFPNYRGSTGYGLGFERGNLFRYGFAEAKDIYSGIDALAARGLADRDKVAVAGHSWGGYLSAFLSTSGDRYKAALVDSGIVDNRVNYVLSNGGAGRQGYLRSTPWEKPQIWEATSATAYIARAKTPTLILQGADDPVVPPENALELQRGLADMGVPVRLAMFKNTEHNIARPKEQLAAMTMNWAWFQRYLWNRPQPLPWENTPLAAH